MRSPFVLVVLVACSRGGGASSPDAESASVAPPSTISPSLPPSDAGEPTARPRSGEAIRSKLARLEDEPRLAPHLAILRDHFGDAAAGPFLAQRVGLAGERTAILVSREDESDPIVLAMDGERLLWSKKRPTAGIIPPARPLALTPHPDGGAVLFAFVPKVRMVAGRVWSDDGSPFADISALPFDDCDALSAAYGQGIGWIVVASGRGGARAELVREDLSFAWPREGVEVGAASRSGAPVSIAFDTRESAMLFQVTTRDGGADRVVAFRYGMHGEKYWGKAVDLGEAGSGRGRVSASIVREAVVRVVWEGGGEGVEVDSAGIVRSLGGQRHAP